MKPNVDGFFGDSVLDYDPKSGRTAATSADKVIAFVRGRSLHVEWILSAAPYLRKALGGRAAIGAQIGTVQSVFRKLFNLHDQFPRFDHLFADGERFRIGDAVFAGDTLFMPDVGSARCAPRATARCRCRSSSCRRSRSTSAFSTWGTRVDLHQAPSRPGR